MIHIVSEILVVAGVVVYFLRKTSSLLCSVRALEENNKTLVARVEKLEQELGQKLARIDAIERVLLQQTPVLPQLLQPQTCALPSAPTCPAASTQSMRIFPQARHEPRIVTFDEQLGISDEDDYEDVKAEKSDIEELAAELAELTSN